MNQITFSPGDVQAFLHQRYHHPDPQVARHMEILFLKSHAADLGLTHRDIATLAGCSLSTVQRTLIAYQQGGIARVSRAAPRPSSGDLDPHRSSLTEWFTQNPPRSVKHARQMILERTGIERGLTQVRHFLHSLGLQPRKVAAIPCPPQSPLEAHVANQKVFLENVLEPKLEEARTGKRQVHFVDAAHFVHSTFLGVLWCVARMFVRATSGRKRFNVLGALNAVTHELISVTNHRYINGESVCELLRAVAAAAVPGIPITLVLDNAPYQKSLLVRDQARESGIELLYLPPYSPNLNLIERVWKFVKGECLRTKYYGKYEDFHNTIQQCLDDLPAKHKEAMDSFLSLKFQTFENVSLIAA